MPWFASEQQFITIGWCFWKPLKNVFRNLSPRASEISFSSRISMAINIKKTKVKLELVKEIDMLLMVEKGISGGFYALLMYLQTLAINTCTLMIKIKNYHI